MELYAFAGNMGSGKDTGAEELQAHGYIRVALADELKRLARAVFGLNNTQLFGPSRERNTPFDSPLAYWEECHRRASLHENWVRHLFLDAPPLSCDPCVELHVLVDRLAASEPQVSTRTILQQLGTEWGRRCWQDVWLNELGGVFEKLAHGGWRYTAEEGLIRDEGAPRYRGVVVTDARFVNEMAYIRHRGGRVFWIDRRTSAPPAGVKAANLAHASEPGYELVAEHIDALILNHGTLDEFRRAVRERCLPADFTA